jgi:hypothetical protein
MSILSINPFVKMVIFLLQSSQVDPFRLEARILMEKGSLARLPQKRIPDIRDVSGSHWFC